MYRWWSIFGGNMGSLTSRIMFPNRWIYIP